MLTGITFSMCYNVLVHPVETAFTTGYNTTGYNGVSTQAMQVRADECHEVPPPLDAARRFADGFQELDADSMGQLSRACRECGLEALFATALKL